jgi:RNA polymerase sigma-70 factor (ECF subfamily)
VTCDEVEQGPPREFDEWYRAAHPRLVAALVGFTGNMERARESVDEACMRALARWARVGVMESPSAWAYRTALNHAKRSLRRAGTERRLLARWRPVEPTLPGPAGEIWDAVGRLPARQRMAVVLRYVADLPEAEVAQIMRVSRGTVASTLFAARRRLGAGLVEEKEGTLGRAGPAGRPGEEGR